MAGPFNPERPAFISGGKALQPVDSAQAVQRGNGSSSVVDSEQAIRQPSQIVPGSFGDGLVPPGTGAPAPPIPPVVGAAGGLTPPANGSWSVPAWFIDPQHGSDANTGTSSTSPLKTYRALVALWGTVSPLLRQTTTITFLSSHTDDSDPVICSPWMEASTMVIQGLLGNAQLAATVTLGGVVAKNRTTGQLLEATLGASAASGMLAVNTSRGNSTAYVNANLGGGTFVLEQPLPAQAVATATTPASLVDTWSNGDTVQLFNPTAINLVSFRPQLLETPSTFNWGAVGNCAIFDPGTSTDSVLWDGNFVALNVRFDRGILVHTTWAPTFVGCQANNLGGANIVTPISIFDFLAEWIGGSSSQGGTFIGVLLDGDVICGNAGGAGRTTVQGLIGTLFIGGGGLFTLEVDLQQNINLYAATAIVWGSGAWDTMGSARVIYPSGAGNAAKVFLQSGGFQLNGQTGAWLVTTGAAPTAGKTLTAAHLDADLGATIGAYLNPGGASISNGSA